VRGDTWDKKTTVTFQDAVEIPGRVLPAGTYVFKPAVNIANRHIVQIWNEDQTQILATIMTVPNSRLDAPDTTVFEFDERPGDSPMAVRYGFYPGENTGEEFLYSGFHY
jgi:hypothetical protein